MLSQLRDQIGDDPQCGGQIGFVSFRWFEKAVGVPGIPGGLGSENRDVRRRNLPGKCDDVLGASAATVNGNEGASRCLERRAAFEYALPGVRVQCRVRARHRSSPSRSGPGHYRWRRQRIEASPGKDLS